MTDKYGNASSIHFMGQENSLVLIKAKEEIGRILNCDHDNIIFTAGATESNNMIIKGVAQANKDKGKHILVSSIEHPSVLEPAEQLKKEGFNVELIPVDSSGVVDLGIIKKMVRPETILISVMTVNNEIGTIQPVEKIGAFARKKGILFHTDAVQAVPYLDIDIKKWNVDFLSVSAHKFNGPKGVGLAYINRRAKIDPLITGGGQEYGLRCGTYNIPGIVGMAEALKLAYKEKRIQELKEPKAVMTSSLSQQPPTPQPSYSSSNSFSSATPATPAMESAPQPSIPSTPTPSAAPTPSLGGLDSGRRVCPNCGASGPAIKEVPDKSKIISYIPKPIYAKKNICSKCGYEF